MRLLILFYCILCAAPEALCQDNKIRISGRLVDRRTALPITEAQLFVAEEQLIIACDASGQFSLNLPPLTTCTLYILFGNELLDSFKVALTKPIIDLGDVAIEAGPVLFQQSPEEHLSIPTLELESPSDIGDDHILNNQNVSVLLNSSGSRDPFMNALSFVFGQYNFRPRGYSRSSGQVFINGILMNDLTSGNAIWAQWAGLNDPFRNQTSTYGLRQGQYFSGALNSTVNFEVSAGEQPAQRKIAYSLSNRSYNNRIMVSLNSGEKKQGWFYAFSAARRWAEEGYLPGTSFDAYSAFFSAEKVLNSKSRLSLSMLGVHHVRAGSGAATEEVYTLAGNNYYNPNWGWQEGEKRNARVTRIFQPLAIAQYQYQASDKIRITTALSYQTGRSQRSSLDWYNAPDPRPDYYRNLPSYYRDTHPAASAAIEASLADDANKLQIDWNRLYNANTANHETIQQLNGVAGAQLSGRRSLYVVGADVEQVNRFALSATIQYKRSRQFLYSSGMQIVHQRTACFRELIDLLGGDYFLNYNMFAAQHYWGNDRFRQNDLNIPDRAVRVGEKYRYNYINSNSKAWGWAQIEADFKRLTLFAAGQAGVQAYQRTGLYKNGLFPASSDGESGTLTFLNYTIKGGIQYKLDGRNYFIVHGLVGAEDPGFNNVFIAPRTRNQIADQVSLQRLSSIEAGYLLRAPRTNIRAIAYATELNNGTDIQRFYNDDPDYQSFVNFVLNKINKRFVGTELAFEYAFNHFFSLSAVASVGQAFYTNRPYVQVYNDNDTNQQPGTREVFIKNYYLGAGPQSAYTAGVHYNSKRYWYLKFSVNYLDRNYVSVNPARRTVEAAELVESHDPLFKKIFDQEQLPSFCTVDLSGGKSFRLNKVSRKAAYGAMLYFNFGMSNVLNRQDIKTAGFEQLRYDFAHNNPDKFPNKYIYGYGRNFFANLSIKF